MVDAATPTSTSELLTGWGRTAPSRAAVWAPRDLEAVADRVDNAGPRGVLARGLGRSYGDAAQNAGGDVLRLTGMDRVLEVDLEKGRATVQAGVSIDALMRAFVPLGWFPTVVPGTRFVTVGGAIASDIHGKFRLGCFCDSVERFQLVTPAHGAMAIDPVSDPDTFWATAGGMGLTGIITEATLQLHPVESAFMSVDTQRAVDVDDCMSRMLESDDRYRYSVAWIDCLARGKHLGRSVLTRGDHATLDQLPARTRASGREFAPRQFARAPDFFPERLLNPRTIAAFNELWFRKAPRERRAEVQSLAQFFHPLDAVLDWNRIYGRRGFIQYQYVVPYGAEWVVRASLERLSAARSASFLAVLKRFEHASRALLGFPMEGWTLTLDLPAAGTELAELLDGLDTMVADAGGRVYLTKDARLAPQLLPAMYPQLPRWREVRGRLDPRHVMRSDMDRRLGLAAPQGGNQS
jgi:decaprenylphospho-beta-D-ribofuranose 2-oxidase